jgi:4-hydroxy-tetrahydrodipicolinate reductase
LTASAAQPRRAVIYGLGKAARFLVAGAAGRNDVSIVGGIDVAPDKVGADVGEVTVGEPSGHVVTDDFAAELARDDVDLVLHAAPGTGEQVKEVIGACLDAGKDVITVNWFIHPRIAFGDEVAAELQRRAEAGGARAVGTGVNPGLLLDVLLVFCGNALSSVDRVYARRVSEANTWGWSVLEYDMGLGKPLEEAPAGEHQLAESFAVVTDGLRLELDRWEEVSEPLPARSARHHEGRVVEPGTIGGFRRRAFGYRGGEVIAELEWLAIYCIDPQADGVENSAFVRLVGGDQTVEASLGGDLLFDPYPATAARMLNAAAVLRDLPPGVYRPDQLPLSPRA